MEERDLEQLAAWFAGYCGRFTAVAGTDPRPYAVKEEHTRNVCGNALRIAGSLSLDASGTAIARAIALFHDVGRFPQYQRYGTFRDSVSVNHAALGAKVLLEEGALSGLPERERRIITSAVTLHNVLALPAGLDDEVLFHTKLVRDADKLDIWRVFIEHYRLPPAQRSDVIVLELPDTQGYRAEVLESLGREEMVRLVDVFSQNDFTLLQLSWVYDLNFSGSFRILDERGYVDDLAATLPRNDEIRKAVERVKDFMERKKG